MPRQGGHGPGRGPGAGGPVEKPQNFKDVLGKLLHFTRSYIPAVVIALVLGAVGTIFQIIGPDKLKDITNLVMKGLPALVKGKPVAGSIDFTQVERIAFTLVALYVGYAVLTYLQSWIMANITQETARKMRDAISKKINKLPLRYFDRVSYGDVLSRITNDVDTIGQTLGQSIGALITSITLFVGSLIMMFANNVIMTLSAIGSSLIGIVLMLVVMKYSQSYFVRQQVALGDVNGHVEEKYAGHVIVKSYNGEESSIRQFEEYNQDLYESGWKSQFLSGLMMPLMNFVGNLGYVVVCVVGAALVINGSITFGVIVAFMMYVRLFTQPLSQFAQAFQNLQRTAAASERVFDFLDEEE
ncbi:ABC transporter permease, partial [Bifidobacterium psychraerophilum]